MPLDPQARALMEQLHAQARPALSHLSATQLRAGDDEIIPLTGEPVVVSKVEQVKIPGPGGPLPLRIYTPAGTGPFPVLVYFHGGGWVVCNLETHDSLCRTLANTANSIVISVDYRLAPENPFPAAFEDAYAVTEWAARHADKLGADPTRIAVGGDSAGGNLAAGVALEARERGAFSVTCQALIYPVLDYYQPASSSYTAYAEGYFLSGKDMPWYYQQYLPSGFDGKDARVAPVLASDLRGLPPALIITAEYDPTRDGAELYAMRLKEAGVEVSLTRYEGMMHAFVLLAGVFEQGRKARQQVGTFLQEALREGRRCG
ncbi:alpha/beta hydrolase [Ktedonosporobacter rubrisoli]|uniref:Alpha/beta hydrolase n=1 Tax=Ktedonosporobacter rubrisoli TaxID=2509675 RepID=A0A4P6JPA7_KTERU|nr:alpha/beta hydrolase [Ktedonosporobacter rubrisoli]QBD76912.1 alpha/beta hydrolase [Ktedonosporobacter rubrisoli]